MEKELNDHSLKTILLVAGWALMLTLFFVSVGYWATSITYQAKMRSIKKHEERMDPDMSEKGRTKAEVKGEPGLNKADPATVETGVYIDRIVEISTKATSWTVDFYIWFKWTDPAIQPGNNFQVVDGEILSKTKKETYQGQKIYYELYRVVARMTKFFDISRFPRDDHLLTIRIEDSARQIHQLIYIADKNASKKSSRVEIPGYHIYMAEVIVKPHSYKTNRGDPRLPKNYKATYSQLIYGIGIARPDWGLYVKMFQGLFSAVMISLLAFFVLPIDTPRFALGIGAFFAAVAATYITKSQLPGVGIITLTDMISGIGLTTVFLTLLSSIIALYLYDKKKQMKLARIMDKLAFIIILVGYVTVNITIALAASYKY